MRVIDLECGHTMQAANDEDLFESVREHVDEDHDDLDLTDEQIRDQIAKQAYDATDS